MSNKQHSLRGPLLIDAGSLPQVLTPAEAGKLLAVRPRQLQRMGVPVLDWGHKTKRYVLEDILRWLHTERENATARRSPKSQPRRAA